MQGSVLLRRQRQYQQIERKFRAEPVTPRIKAMQVEAWSAVGGKEILDRFQREWEGLVAFGQVFTKEKKPPSYLNRMLPYCNRIGLVASDAISYFDVPDAQAQKLWQRFWLNAGESMLLCRKGLSYLNTNQQKKAHDALAKSLREVSAAHRLSQALDSRIEQVKTAGGM